MTAWLAPPPSPCGPGWVRRRPGLRDVRPLGRQRLPHDDARLRPSRARAPGHRLRRAGQYLGVGARALGYLISSERLVQLRRDGRIEPSLAERWEQSTDGLTWRFPPRTEPHLSRRHADRRGGDRASHPRLPRRRLPGYRLGRNRWPAHHRRPDAAALGAAARLAQRRGDLQRRQERGERGAVPLGAEPARRPGRAGRARHLRLRGVSRNTTAAIPRSTASISSCSRTRATPGRP